MKKKLIFSKQGYLVLAFSLFLSLGAFSQSAPSFYNLNTSTGGNTFPLGGATNKVQWVYGPNLFKTSGATGTASGAGTITRIYFRITTASPTTTYTNYTVSLAQNFGTATAFTSTTFLTGLTRCFFQSSYQMTGATANSWYGITLQTPFSYDPTKSLIFELTVSSTAGTNYMAQSTSNGRIWGTYGSTTGTGFGTGLVDFGIDLAKGSNDAGISAIKTPLCAPLLTVNYQNGGINAIDSVKINWSVNGSMQQQNRYNTVLAAGQNIDVNLTPNYNFIDGDVYTVKVWTSLPNNKNDTVNKNDTNSITFKYQGPAGTPGVKDVIKCGPGRAPLVATPVYQGDSILWYNAATGGNQVAKGKNTLSPPLVLGVNTFYAQAFKMSPPIRLANGMTGPTYCTSAYATSYVGSMMDFVPKADVVIDSFGVDFYQFISNSTYSVYYKTNTYIGFESNAGAWTNLVLNQRANVVSVGGKNRGYLKIPQTSLTKGVTYGFYITTTPTTGNDLFATSGSSTWSDANLSISGGKYIYGTGPFANQIANYYIDLETFYKTQSCPSSRVPVQVTVKPSPNGAAFVKSTPFQTTQPNTLGTVGNPDIVAKGDVLTYEITPPTTYNNVDYGSTWIMSGFTFRTKSGRVLPASYYTPTNPTPSGSTNAKVTFTADADIVDSTIIMTVSIFDLGPHYCDSLLTRNIFVAPRPETNFRFGQPVCDGDNVIFTNLTTVSSGNVNHFWDFNTGNPADTSNNADVVFKFPTYGTYDVKLTSVSVPYGYKVSKTIQVVVTEIPKIGFNVFNACLGDSVRFVNKTTISSGTIAYKWDFGNGSSSTKTNTGQKYNAAGGYKVTLTATSNGCEQRLTKNAQQFSRPVAKFSLPAVLCDKTDIAFVNNSTIAIGNMGYNWNFGDGGVSGFSNPTHSFSTAGVKTVKMKVLSEFGCADSITKSFTLAEAPVADFTTGAVCNLTPTAFTFTGSKPAGALTTFLWDFAGESTTTVENPNRLFSVIGKRAVTLTLTSNNGCTDKISKEVNVKLQSKANFDVSDVCEDEEAVFTNNSSVSAGNLVFNWKFGNSKTSNIQSPRHLYNIAGTSQTFNVTLVAIVPDGCSDSISKPVTVNAKPVSDFNFSTTGRLVNFTANQPGNTTYQYDFGDGGKAASPNSQYHFLNYPSGKYRVCLSVFNAAGCHSQTCKEVSISGGISKVEKNSGVSVYPNPNNGNFTVSVAEPQADIAIEIYNVLGKHLQTVEANALKSVYNVQLNNAGGIYLVKVTNNGVTSTQKITINP